MALGESHIGGSSIERDCQPPPSELLLDRRRIELGDFRKAIFLRRMRAADEGAAHLGAVPARHDAETQRLFGFDVARGENLHRVPLRSGVRAFAETPVTLAVRLLSPNSHDFLFKPRSAPAFPRSDRPDR